MVCNSKFQVCNGYFFINLIHNRIKKDGDSQHPSSGMMTVSMVARDTFYEHLSFRDKRRQQTFLAFLLPSSKHQLGVQSGVISSLTFSNSSLVHLMSHLAIVCLGCCVFDVPLCMQIHTTRGWSWETDVSHMCSECHSFSIFMLYFPLILFCLFFSDHRYWLLILCNHFSSETSLEFPKYLLFTV